MDHKEDYKLSKIPIVYTTKLDHMNIIMSQNILRKMSSRTFFQNVENESRPELKRKKRKQNEPDIFYITEDNHYKEVKKRVIQLNEYIDETKQRNEKLLDMCKPAKVVLHDIKHYTQYQKYINHREDNVIHKVKAVRLSQSEFKIRFGQYLDNSSQTISMPSNEITNIISRPHQKCFKDMNLIAINYMPSKVIDLYYFDIVDFHIKEYVILHSEIDLEEYETRLKWAKIVFSEKNVADMTCCCWYARDKFVEFMSSHIKVMKKFLRKKHLCDAYNCLCCCKPSSPNVKLMNALLKNDGHSVRPKYSVTVDQGFPNVVQYSTNAYLENFTELKSNKKKQLTQNKNFKATSIRFQNKYYQIGDNGRIKLFVNGVTDDIANVIANTCCWYAQEKAIDHLPQLGVMDSDNVSFLRTIHQCSLGRCVCCCKPKINKTRAELKTFTISQRHTVDCARKRLNIKIKFPNIVKYQETHLNTGEKTNDCAVVSANNDKSSSILPTSNISNSEPTSEHGPKMKEILEKMKSMRFIVTLDGTVLANLGRVLKQFDLVELKVIDYIFGSLENIKPTPISNNTANCKDMTNVLDLYKNFSSLSKTKNKCYLKSFTEFNSKCIENRLKQPSDIIKKGVTNKETTTISSYSDPQPSTSSSTELEHNSQNIYTTKSIQSSSQQLEVPNRIRIKTPMEISKSAILDDKI